MEYLIEKQFSLSRPPLLGSMFPSLIRVIGPHRRVVSKNPNHHIVIMVILDQCSRSRVLYAEKGDNNWVNQPTNHSHTFRRPPPCRRWCPVSPFLCVLHTQGWRMTVLCTIYFSIRNIKKRIPSIVVSSLCIVNGWLGGNWVNPTTVQIIYPCLCYRVHISSGYMV